MEYSEIFKKNICSYLEEISKSANPVVIFGTARAGWYIMKVLQYFEVPIAAFSSNNHNQQKTFYNYPIMSPEEIQSQFPNAHIFLGVFMPDTAAAISKQFEHLNLRKVYYEMASFLFTYFIDVAGRKCDHEILAKSIHILFENYKEGQIHYGRTEGNYFVSPFVTSVITQKCTLRCRDCIQRIPYYQKPVNFPVKSVINDLKKYAEGFDVVPEISLQGGEPFIHPHIKEICREAAAISNIVFISFVTNGSLMLSEDTLQTLSECGADVQQSGGYGSLSKYRDTLTETFNIHNIYSDVMYCSPSEMWSRMSFKKHNRKAVANNAIYKTCIASKTCCQLMNGELHRCSLSMHGTTQRLFPKYEDDFVKLHETNKPKNYHVSQIQEFIKRESAISICDYCDPEGGITVLPAIQLPLKDKRDDIGVEDQPFQGD